jgi:hypothetical protein
MTVKSTVIVCMVGYDYQRIIDGLEKWQQEEPVEHVYLMHDEKKDKYGLVSQRNVKDLVRTLRKRGVHSTKIGYNPQSYEDTFSSLYSILKREVEEKNRRVLIDSTSTTKDAYGATVTISLMFTNVQVYIVPPKERGYYVPSQGNPDFEEWFSKVRSVPGLPPQEIYLPGYRLEKPKGEDEEVLRHLEAHDGVSDSIKAIMGWCGCDSEDPVTKNRFSRVINRLFDKRFVKKEPVEKKMKISLTKFGRIFAASLRKYEEHQ